MLQQIPVFMLRTPELGIVLQVGCHQSEVEEQNYLKFIPREKCLFLLCVFATSVTMGPLCTVDANASESVLPAPEKNVLVLQKTAEYWPVM